MNQPNDMHEDLSAYLDGELSPQQAAELEASLQTDEELARELDRLRSTRALLGNLPHEPAPEDFASRVVAQAERTRLMAADTDEPPAAGQGGWARPLAIAAGLLLVAGLGVMFSAPWWLPSAGDAPGQNGNPEIAKTSETPTTSARPERPALRVPPVPALPRDAEVAMLPTAAPEITLTTTDRTHAADKLRETFLLNGLVVREGPVAPRGASPQPIYASLAVRSRRTTEGEQWIAWVAPEKVAALQAALKKNVSDSMTVARVAPGEPRYAMLRENGETVFREKLLPEPHVTHPVVPGAGRRNAVAENDPSESPSNITAAEQPVRTPGDRLARLMDRSFRAIREAPRLARGTIVPVQPVIVNLRYNAAPTTRPAGASRDLPE